MSFVVRKADGTTEEFSPDKLRFSLRRAGASPLTIEKIVSTIEEESKGELTTHQIYKNAFEQLKREKSGVASRYSLKRAVFDLGPTGFPFEDFIAEIMKARGYSTQTRLTLQGGCAEHELDMIATREHERIGAELKFHNSPGLKTDLKVALYVWARFQDLNKRLDDRTKNFTQTWLLTNTKFTTQAKRYGTCIGLQLISWSYPKQGNLQDLIEESGLHPVTCLTSLSKSHKQHLLSSGNVLCRSVPRNTDVLEGMGINSKKMEKVMEEIHNLCGVPKG